MSSIWNAVNAGTFYGNGEDTFTGAYFDQFCHRHIIPGVPLYKSEYGGHHASRQFSVKGEWDCTLCQCDCNECEHAGIAATTIGVAVALDAADEMMDFYSTAVVGVLGRGDAAGVGSAAWGMMGIGVTRNPKSYFAIGGEMGTYNLTNNPFGFNPEDSGVYDYSQWPLHPHPNQPPVWNNPCSLRERINYLCWVSGIPLNQFWIPADPATYPQRPDSFSSQVDPASPFYSPNATLGAMDDPDGQPNWEWQSPPFPLEGWYWDQMKMVQDGTIALAATGMGKYPTGYAIAIKRLQRYCKDLGGRFRNGIVFSNTDGNSVFDALMYTTPDETNVGNGPVPAGMSWSLRGMDFRDTMFKYGAIGAVGFLVDQSGNFIANGLWTLAGSTGQNGVWFGMPFMPSETNVPQWTDCLPAMRSNATRTKAIFTFYYPGATQRHFVIDNATQSTYWTTANPF
jgi:hypothetical protein